MSNKIIVILVIVAALAGIIFGVGVFKQPAKLGSVSFGGEYQATTTANWDAGAALSGEKNIKVATTTPLDDKRTWDKHDNRLGSLTLGSIIIGSTTPKWMKIWDATSTLDVSSRTVAFIDGEKVTTEGVNAQTLTFDIIMNRGVVIQTETGFWGGYTITWR